MPGLLPQKTIVPIDFSELSYQSLERAIEIAGQASAVHVIHVLPELNAMEPGVMYQTVTDETRVENTKAFLKKKFAEDQYPGLVVHATVGDPGHKVADYAQQEGADLIVLPSHGRTGLKHLLLGSVAERVVRLAHCDVLVLRR